MFVLVLEMSGKDFAVLFVDVLHRTNPFALAVRVIATARTLYSAKILRDQFIWRKMIFLHVSFTVGVMLLKVLAAYYATMVAANAAADNLDAIIAIETGRSLSLSHKQHRPFEAARHLS